MMLSWFFPSANQGPLASRTNTVANEAEQGNNPDDQGWTTVRRKSRFPGRGGLSSQISHSGLRAGRSYRDAAGMNAYAGSSSAAAAGVPIGSPRANDAIPVVVISDSPVNSPQPEMVRKNILEYCLEGDFLELDDLYPYA